MSNIVKSFRQDTDKLFHKIDGYSARELEQIIRKQIESIILESNLDVLIKDVILSGSRCRGLEHNDSDLDFILSFSGQEREDVLFDVLNESEIEISGIKVDINPISEGKSGNLDTYLIEVEQYLRKSKMRS